MLKKEKVEKDTDDNLTEYIVLLEKNIGKVMRRLDKRSRNNVTINVKDNLPPNVKGFNPQCKGN